MRGSAASAGSKGPAAADGESEGAGPGRSQALLGRVRTAGGGTTLAANRPRAEQAPHLPAATDDAQSAWTEHLDNSDVGAARQQRDPARVARQRAARGRDEPAARVVYRGPALAGRHASGQSPGASTSRLQPLSGRIPQLSLSPAELGRSPGRGARLPAEPDPGQPAFGPALPYHARGAGGQRSDASRVPVRARRRPLPGPGVRTRAQPAELAELAAVPGGGSALCGWAERARLHRGHRRVATKSWRSPCHTFSPDEPAPVRPTARRGRGGDRAPPPLGGRQESERPIR